MKLFLVSCCLVAYALAAGDPSVNEVCSCLANCATLAAGLPATKEEPVIPGVRIVPRAMWGAQPPKDTPEPLKVIPAPYVIISHTATEFCFTQAECVMRVRFAQVFHMENYGWNDIGYNFLVGGDGNVYEGRGWDIEGAHTFNYNFKSIGITFIGAFDTTSPTDAQVAAARNLLKFALENGKISQEYKLLGHRQVVKTESPGQKLYEIIQTWDHWSPTP